MDYFISSDNVKIFYKITGEGIPIIFIHGYTATHDVFRLPEKVLGKKYKIITYDLRGHGSSVDTEKELNLNILARDLRELIHHLKLDHVILVGWSMGGSIIFEYLTQYGEENLSKICLVDTSPKIINDKNWNLGLYHGKYTSHDGINDLESIKTDWLNFGERFIKIMASNLKDNQLIKSIEMISDNKPELMYSLWKSAIEKDYRDILDRISIPTLLLFGEKSTLYSMEVARYLNKNITDSYLIIFENCTHLLVLENPVKFNRVLEEFINNKK